MKTEDDKLRPDLETVMWAPVDENGDAGEDGPLHYVDPNDPDKTLCGETIPHGERMEFGVWSAEFCEKCHELSEDVEAQ